MFLTLKRTFREAVKNFIRNGWLSIATVSILALSLYVLSVFVIVTSEVDNILKDIQNKVNISIYLKSDVTDNMIDQIKNDLSKMPEIKSIEYISKEKALDEFKRVNASEPVILESLEEIGENPLLASLVVKSNDTTQYQKISDHISQASYVNEISRMNYGKNKEIINKLNSIVATIRRVGVSLGTFFALVSLLITFNAIRITIYTHKPEIEIMRLVGASNFFIRLPFIFEGVIYGLASSFLAMFILFISIKFTTPYVTSVIPSNNLLGFYFDNFFSLLGSQIVFGSTIGVVGSIIAMRKYLKV